ncbi:MAG: bifunctional phosphopantothenoylcysteine decarboxylase/phosphopantothenate--cysteine ligase CoaBC [Gammaproteobacteria bacterium]|nr:bifunctional phosphopantothenoylcysteine decarboxylase/phosphopantothenate--cysteine ligase CoaBC [Gammaproteobacteria bacterium]
MTQGNHSTSDLRPVLQGRRILLGVSGGIAAYKSPLLVRRLREAGADVQVVITRSAARFVTTTTLQAVSGRPVRNDLWDEGAEAAMGHIELARWAELLVVAPATADILSRFADGRADDLLTTLRLATRAPVLLAPAMNVAMWEHAATQRNIARLREDGCSIADPDSGPMACGEFGPGRMVEPEALLTRVASLLGGGADMAADAIPALRGRRILITAGPTREAIDPVRFISNHSSGKQGYALAAAAREAGASVTLVSGPVALTVPQGVTTVAVTSAQDMYDAVMARVDDCDIFIGVAAVADYRPASAAGQKLKKSAQGSGERSLDLVENPDIIAAVARREPRPLVIGFAAETQDAVAFARDKRRRKGLDMIVVNDVSDPDSGFNSDDNTVTIITDEAETQLPRTSKAQVARAILEAAARSLGGTPH